MGPFALITTENLTVDEVYKHLSNRIAMRKVKIDGVDSYYCDGVYNDEKACIFFASDGTILEEYMENGMEKELSDLLGGKPKTCFVIEMLLDFESYYLTIDFIKLFSDHWNCVLNTFEKTYNKKEIDRIFETREIIK